MHLGLDIADPDVRERRFVSFLKGLPQETKALYLLGDIWDFWYEYRDVVPKGYVRVFAALQDLMDRGVQVFFFQGNHDVWTYRYFEELGMKRLVQPALVEISGKKFCLGHGDGLGPVPVGYRILRGVFHNRVLQFLFSMLHPWVAFGLGNGWSKSNRLSHDMFSVAWTNLSISLRKPLIVSMMWIISYSATIMQMFIWLFLQDLSSIFLRIGSMRRRFSVLTAKSYRPAILWSDVIYRYFSGIGI